MREKELAIKVDKKLSEAEKSRKINKLRECEPSNINRLSKALQTKPSTAGTICSGVNSSPTIPRWRANVRATIDVAKLS